MKRSFRSLTRVASLATLAAALTGCYVMPVAQPNAPVVVAGGHSGQVVYTQPAYPAPAVGYVWGWNPVLSLFGWFHPRHGWHGGHGHGGGYGHRR